MSSAGGRGRIMRQDLFFFLTFAFLVLLSVKAGWRDWTFSHVPLLGERLKERGQSFAYESLGFSPAPSSPAGSQWSKGDVCPPSSGLRSSLELYPTEHRFLAGCQWFLFATWQVQSSWCRSEGSWGASTQPSPAHTSRCCWHCPSPVAELNSQLGSSEREAALVAHLAA